MQDNVWLVWQMVCMGKLLIVVVEGWVVGVGLFVVLVCDSIVCGVGVCFVVGFGKVGLFVDFGQLYILLVCIGWGWVWQILMFGQVVEVEEVLCIGLVDCFCVVGGVLVMVLELVGWVEQQVLLFLVMIKVLFVEGFDLLLEWEGELQSQLFFSVDYVEGKVVFFVKCFFVFRGN